MPLVTTSPMSKRFLLVMGPLVCLSLLAAGLYWNYVAPRTLLSLSWNGSHWTVSEDLGKLRAGDVVASLNEHPVEFHTFLMDNAFLSSRSEFWRWLKVRSQVYSELCRGDVSLGVERDGSAVSATIPISRDSWAFLRNPGAVHILVGLIFLLVGWGTYRPEGTDRKAFWFYLLCCSMSLVYLSNALALLGEFALQPAFFRFNNIVNTVNFVLAPALLLHFSLLMPRDRTRPWLLAVLYGLVGYALLSFRIALHGPMVALLFLASLVAIAQGALSYRGVLERQQMKWVGVGFLLGLGPWILLNGLPLLFLGQRLISDTLPGACLVFIPIFMAVAVRKYRLFDVGAFLENTALYLLTLALLIGVDILALSLLDNDSSLNEGALVSLALLLGLYGPTRAAMTRLVARYAHRSSTSGEELEQLLDSQLRGCELEEIVDGLKVVIQQYLAPATLERSESQKPTGAYLEVGEEATVTVVVVPGEALRCGPPAAGRVYSSEVMARLSELAGRCELHYQVLFQSREAESERMRRLEEREALLSDLHDGIGAALSSIRLTSKEPRVSRLAGDAIFELQNYLYPGPGYSLTLEQFVAELRGYGNSVFGHDGPRFELRASELSGSLERSKALSIFRLLKESMNNTLKHAGASRYEIGVRRESGDLLLEVWDDGSGLPAGEVSRGRGLESMRSRVEHLGGNLEVSSDEGLRIQVRVPL